jgi:hypothetical protein
MSEVLRRQPLRISSGWKITKNDFFELDPPDVITKDSVFWCDETIFIADYSLYDRKLLMDLSWKNSDNGFYVLYLAHSVFKKTKMTPKKTIQIKKDEDVLEYDYSPTLIYAKSNWENSILKTRSRIEVVEKMDDIFANIYKPDSEYWKCSLKFPKRLF